MPNNPLPALGLQLDAQPEDIKATVKRLKAIEKRCVDFMVNHPSCNKDLVKAFAIVAFAKPEKRTTPRKGCKQKVFIFCHGTEPFC